MRILVISNDVVPGFGIPVAAPGLRAHGLALGLRAHGFEVEVAVPADVLALATTATGAAVPPPPPATAVVSPPDLIGHIKAGSFEVVVFINANLTPHLAPIAGVHFVYDMFAPKLLERLASPGAAQSWDDEVALKERALGLADSIWVNGRRKLGYALGWVMRPGVERWRVEEFGRSSLFESDPATRLTLVEMPVAPIGGEHDPLPDPDRGEGSSRRAAVAGYAQAWSALASVHPCHQAIVDAGHELHALLPAHWAQGDSAAPVTALPEGVVLNKGPLRFDRFADWVTSMDVMVDVFEPSAERRFAMITRSVVALGLGVPVIHGVDSEVADIIEEFDAGWLVIGNDSTRWQEVAAELKDPMILARKRSGARRASAVRFEPSAALAQAAAELQRIGSGR